MDAVNGLVVRDVLKASEKTRSHNSQHIASDYLLKVSNILSIRPPWLDAGNFVREDQGMIWFDHPPISIIDWAKPGKISAQQTEW